MEARSKESPGCILFAPGLNLSLPTDRMDPSSEQLLSLGCEVASDVYSEVSCARDSTEHSGSGDPLMNPTKACPEPACRQLEVSMGTSRFGYVSDPSILPMKM